MCPIGQDASDDEDKNDEPRAAVSFFDQHVTNGLPAPKVQFTAKHIHVMRTCMLRNISIIMKLHMYDRMHVCYGCLDFMYVCMLVWMCVLVYICMLICVFALFFFGLNKCIQIEHRLHVEKIDKNTEKKNQHKQTQEKIKNNKKTKTKK